MENGDQCDGQMGAALGTHNGASYNQVINGHFYWYQEEWSNDGHQCLQRYTPPTTLPRAKYTVTPGSGLAMTFDATGSFAPGGIADFSWQFNAVTNASTIEKTSPTETFTFPVAGTYSTGLTVYSHTGLSRGAGGLVTTGASGFTPGFSFSPAAPVHGTPVTFTGLSTISRLKVKNYLWEFGDGAAGSGQSPSHTYAAAGTYKVEVIEFSGVGSAYPGSGAAPVATATVTVS
jgi:PKD repeat protein